MGEIVLAAKCTHVPTMLMSEQEGPIHGTHQPAIDGLMDAAWPEAELQQAHRVIEAELAPALEYHDLKSRRSGSEAFLSFHLVMDDDTTVIAAHSLCDRIQGALERTFPGVHTTIHVEPEHELERPRGSGT